MIEIRQTLDTMPYYEIVYHYLTNIKHFPYWLVYSYIIPQIQIVQSKYRISTT